jgi:hypothetical protein
MKESQFGEVEDCESISNSDSALRPREEHGTLMQLRLHHSAYKYALTPGINLRINCGA